MIQGKHSFALFLARDPARLPAAFDRLRTIDLQEQRNMFFYRCGKET